MKKKIIQCDICGREIHKNKNSFKFKATEKETRIFGRHSYLVDDVKNCDMCEDCYRKFLRFIEMEKFKNEI